MIVFLPKSTTSHLPPLDPGIIQSFKVKYRKKLTGLAEDRSASEIASTIAILQAIDLVFKSYNEVSLNTIENCFAKCRIVGETAEYCVELDDFVDLFNELTKETDNMDNQMTGDRYANFDNEECTSLL